MNQPDSRKHGQLTVTRISVPDALRFLDQHTTSGVPTGARFAIAITAQTRPGQTPAVVAVAVTGRHRGFGGPVAKVAVAFTDPTTRMRRMLLAAVWDTARASGYQILLVNGDYRYPNSTETQIQPRSLDRRSRHRRSRARGQEMPGRSVTSKLIENPDRPWWAPGDGA